MVVEKWLRIGLSFDFFSVSISVGECQFKHGREVRVFIFVKVSTAAMPATSRRVHCCFSGRFYRFRFPPLFGLCYGRLAACAGCYLATLFILLSFSFRKTFN